MKNFNELSKEEIVEESKDFFNELIEKTGTYYLSDYVEEYGEFDQELVSEEEHIEIVKLRNTLRDLCLKNGIDFHAISCEVGNDFLRRMEIL